MARYRTVKPELYSDEKLCEVSRGSRLLFIGLLNFADDMGRKAYAPKRIKMEIFLGDEDVAPKQVSVWIHQLEQAHVLKSMKWTDTPTSGFQLSSHIRKSISPDIPPILRILKTLIPTVNASNAKRNAMELRSFLKLQFDEHSVNP